MIEYIFASYILFSKFWPYFLYPNYFRKSKIEDYDEIKNLANKLKNKNKEKTIENVYNYMNQTYSGINEIHNLKSLLTVFQVGDFSTKDILNKKQFLWCHNQNRLMKSILVNTNQFEENEIKIKKRYFSSFFIHQWIFIEINDKQFLLDPFYQIKKITKF